MAQERASAEPAELGTELKPEDYKGAVAWVKVLALVLLAGVLILLHRAANMVNYDPTKGIKSNWLQARLMLLFGIVLFGWVIWHFVYDFDKLMILNQESASEHGVEIDRLFAITAIITVVAFFVVEAALFWFAFTARGRKGSRATYYPDNHKLELVWTVIPAVGIVAMIVPGLKYWSHYSYPEDHPKTVEISVMAEQFVWTGWYPGKDGKFGKYDFRQIGSDNPLGLDSADASRNDDIITRELYIPKGYQCKFNVRSKDVLHGFFLPHFRAHIYAVPGMPTEVTFVPRFTTEEAREQYGDPEFNYAVACSQICGGSHYKMKMNVVVVEKDEYDKWLAEQKPYFAADEAPAEGEEGETDGDAENDSTPAEGETPEKQAQADTEGSPLALRD